MRGQVAVSFILLREPQPAAEDRYETAMWHYARALAFLRLRERGKALPEMAALRQIIENKENELQDVPELPAASLLRQAERILLAEIAGLNNDADVRILELQKAVGLQDNLPYMEPPFWYFPVRQGLGAALVQAGRFAEAEKVYREDLKRHPENGWSLFGLLQCLRGQGKEGEARDVDKRFRDAWRSADVTLTASWF